MNRNRKQVIALWATAMMFAVCCSADDSKVPAPPTRPVSADNPQHLSGKTRSYPEWGSGALLLSTPTDFPKGTKLRLTIGGSAEKVMVRLLPEGDSPDSTSGIVGSPITVPKDRVVEVTLDTARNRVTQISVHGGPNPWGKFPLPGSNGPATVEAIDVIRP